MRLLLSLVLALAVSGCVTQNELALSRNVYKLDIDARGSFAMEDAAQSTQRRAAELTLSKGYTHYIIADANSERGSEVVGMTPWMSRTTSDVRGSTTYRNTYHYGGPIVEERSRTTLIVVMFTPMDAPPDALDARQVLAYSR